MKKISIYEINKLIAKGASSSVFKGTNTLTNETVAIKMISISDMDSHHELESIEQEIKILKSLNHPNIVSIKDFKKTKNNIYLIFEYCSKGNLETYLNKIHKKNIPETIVKKIINQLAKGLKELKEKRIVHGDLKLANILISDDNKIKLSDFGFAKILENKFDLLQSYCPTSMTYYHTSMTVAPEILNKGFYNEKCDIWSIGIILYKMLTGNYPFEEELDNMNDFLEIIFPKDIIISEEVKNLIRKMLIVDYEKRISFNDFFNNEWLNDKKNNIKKNIELNNYNENNNKNNFIISNKSNTYDIINNEKRNYIKTINIREFCDIDNISLKQSFDFNENLPDIHFLASEFEKLNK